MHVLDHLCSSRKGNEIIVLGDRDGGPESHLQGNLRSVTCIRMAYGGKVLEMFGCEKMIQ